MEIWFSTWYLWLIAAVVLFIVEIVSSGFVVACFGMGALGATLIALLGLGASWQVGAFAVVSLLSFLVVRPIVERRMRLPAVATGVDALIGRRIRLREAVHVGSEYLELPVDGDVWRAKLIEPQGLEVGQEVEIVRIDGIVLEVRPV